MNSHEQLLAMLTEDQNLAYLKVDYKQIIESMKNTNLTFRQMFAILCAAEKDCFKFTQEIERLNYYTQSNSSTTQLDDEYKEIIYEIEQKLNMNIKKLCEEQLINFSLINYDEMNYSVTLDLLTKFVDTICLNKQADNIINQQLKEEMKKYQKKNFSLQLENMKILSNTNTKKKQSKSDQFNLLSQQNLRLKFQFIVQEISKIKEELGQVKLICQKQYQLIFHQDQLFDKLLTDNEFNQSYHKIINHLRNQQNHQNLNGQLKQSLIASQQINNKDIQGVFEKLKLKLNKLIHKTLSEILIKFEEICMVYQINSAYLDQVLSQTKNNFSSILKYYQMLLEIINDKEELQNQIRTSFESLIFKINNENLNLKLLQLTKILEKTIKRQNSHSLESLKSIQYK